MLGMMEVGVRDEVEVMEGELVRQVGVLRGEMKRSRLGRGGLNEDGRVIGFLTCQVCVRGNSNKV